MYKFIHLVLALIIFCTGHASADPAKNIKSGVTIIHTDNRAAGWIDIGVEDSSRPHEANFMPSASVIAASDKKVEGCINPTKVSGIAQTSRLFIGSSLQHHHSRPASKAAAKCVLKKIKKSSQWCSGAGKLLPSVFWVKNLGNDIERLYKRLYKRRNHKLRTNLADINTNYLQLILDCLKDYFWTWRNI